MSSLADARCFQHVSREAVARCPACERFYCRECVTEHDGRMICRPCLDLLIASEVKVAGGFFRSLRSWALAGAGYLLAVYVFYKIGRVLLSIPSEFHSGGFLD